MRRIAQTLGLCLIFVGFLATAPASGETVTAASPLSLPNATNDAAALVVAPASGARFTVTGTANDRFCVVGPADTTLSHSSGSTVPLTTFTGSPAFGTNCCALDATGNATLWVGATRGALAPSNPSGNYTATFTVSVQRYNTRSNKCTGPVSTATGTATMRVVNNITITKAADLRFGQGIATDNALVVAASASASPTVGPASFTVTGEPSSSFSISVTPASVTMTNGACGANCQIVVNQFTSSPASPTLSAGGSATIYIGATRAALPGTQVPGSYSGSFTVTVAYP